MAGPKEHQAGNQTTLIFKGSLSGIIGAFLGMVISLIVNCTLVEISLSAFFSMYFGILFIAVGVIILWRILGQESTDGTQTKRLQLTCFAILIILSGLVCFVLERNWFVGLTALSKVPLYTILGVSVAFALTFSVVDLINYVLGFLQVSIAKPLVESTSQVYSVLMLALVMGGIFGFVFGMMDVEDEVSYQMDLSLKREESYCYPIGAVLGCAGGVMNEYFRKQAELAMKTEWDEDI